MYYIGQVIYQRRAYDVYFTNMSLETQYMQYPPYSIKNTDFLEKVILLFNSFRVTATARSRQCHVHLPDRTLKAKMEPIFILLIKITICC
jgi:hypothetical protein